MRFLVNKIGEIVLFNRVKEIWGNFLRSCVELIIINFVFLGFISKEFFVYYLLMFLRLWFMVIIVFDEFDMGNLKCNW